MDPATVPQACSNRPACSMSPAKAATSSFRSPQKSLSSHEPHPRTALDHQGISRCARGQRRGLYAQQPGDPRTGRRKRRRQVDADEDHCRRRDADIRRDAAREEKPAPFKVPKDALVAGIAMVYQENSLVPALTVAQNIFLGQERFFNRMRGVNISAQQFLQSLNFGVDPTASVGSLGAAQRQMVEIARAVRQKARIIIFDEPTASLTPEEKFHFFGLMRRLKQTGVSIIFFSP